MDQISPTLLHIATASGKLQQTWRFERIFLPEACGAVELETQSPYRHHYAADTTDTRKQWWLYNNADFRHKWQSL